MNLLPWVKSNFDEHFIINQKPLLNYLPGSETILSVGHAFSSTAIK